ncbi:MAG: winged helix DNA-binding domain-containing protein [Acidobacteria bacterium]|nr:winged helix DNA-binding domain-containing protein [Acidobacteriota bacterium]
MPVAFSAAVDDARLQAWWFRRQGLDGSLRGHPPAEVLSAAGWARSVGGANPYLTLFSRAGIRRAEADAAAARLDICELPSARGCTHVLPAPDFGLGLMQSDDDTDLRKAAKLGVPAAEIDKLCRAILDALAGDAALDPDALRKAAGDACRSLGEPGKKVGLSTTLPVALGRLQSAGEIVRVPAGGRLDQQRFSYRRWSENPRRSLRLAREQAHTELARRYFRWIGPASLAEFQWFSGLGVKAASGAVEPLGLKPLNGRLILPDDLERLQDMSLTTTPQYALVSSIDGLVLHRRNIRTLGVGSEVPLVGGFVDLPSHAIFDRGRLIGLWEFDPADGSIVYKTWDRVTSALRKVISELETFIREDLGDARSFSLDSPKSRAPRLEALRA